MEAGGENLVHALIDAFGGPSAMARALEHRHVTTIIAWRNAGRVPRWRRPEIIAAAQRLGIELPPAFLVEPIAEPAGEQAETSDLEDRATVARSVA